MSRIQEGTVQVRFVGTNHQGAEDWRVFVDGITFTPNDALGLSDSSTLRGLVFPMCDPSKISETAWSMIVARQSREGRRTLAALAFEWVVWGTNHSSRDYFDEVADAYDSAVECWHSSRCDALLTALRGATELGP